MPCLVLPVGKLWMEWHTEGQGSGSSAEAVPQMWLRGGPLKEPNPQAVEAAAQELYEDAMAETVDEGLAIPGADAEPEGVWDGEHKPIRELFRRQASKAVQAAEPHIRSQLLAELALDARSLKALQLQLPEAVWRDAVKPILDALLRASRS